MLISVEELKLRPVSVSEAYPTGALDYQTAEFRQLGSLKVRGTAELAGQEIRFRGRLTTRVGSTCDRCLGPVEIPVECDFDLTYRPMATIARREELEVSAGELEVGFYSGPGIEVAEVAAEQVNLFMPMQVLCSPDCRGLCPTCGANRNQQVRGQACGCTEAAPEPTLAVLLQKFGGREAH